MQFRKFFTVVVSEIAGPMDNGLFIDMHLEAMNFLVSFI